MLDNLEEELNKEQYDAVVSKNRSLLIIAGAGTGKTRVITYRIAYLIKKYDVRPGNILAVTFTNKAAAEMKSRLYSLIGALSTALHIGTFHSICLNILKTDGHFIGMDDSYSVIDQDDRLVILKRIIKDLGIDDKRYPPRKYLHSISEFKNTMGYVNHYKPNETMLKLSLVFDKYQEQLNSSRFIDFDDMLSLVVRMFYKDSSVLEKYREIYKHILVDEYQDTNKIQSTFLSLIGKGNNICVVGDDDQSIYGWRGAEIANILNFDKEYEDVKEIKLVENYRAGQKILDIANNVIEYNINRRGKTLVSAKEIDAEIRYETLSNESLESNFIIEEIKTIFAKDRENVDIAILYRKNSQSRNFEISLNRAGIKHKVIGATSFYQRKEVKDILSYLRVYENRFDILSFRRSLKIPTRGIGDGTIDKVIIYSQTNGVDLLHSLVDSSAVSKKQQVEIDKYLQLFIKLDSIVSIRDKINYIVENIDYLLYLRQYDDIDTANKRVDNIAELYSAAVAFEESVEGVNLRDFLASTSLTSSATEEQDLTNTVKLMTIHASKGLEFDTVFITGLEEGLFPSSQSSDDGDIEEERRLCYVALTRAKRRLYLTSARERLTYGKRSRSPSSIFLREMGMVSSKSSDRLDRSVSDNYSDYGDESMSDNYSGYGNSSLSGSSDGYGGGSLSKSSSDSFSVADKVSHTVFGDGVVLSIDRSGESEKIVVHFKSSGQKKILSSFLDRR